MLTNCIIIWEAWYRLTTHVFTGSVLLGAGWDSKEATRETLESKSSQVCSGTETTLQFTPRWGMRKWDWSEGKGMLSPHLGPENSTSKLCLRETDDNKKFSQLLQQSTLWDPPSSERPISLKKRKMKRSHFFTTPWKGLRYLIPCVYFAIAVKGQLFGTIWQNSTNRSLTL